MKSEQLRLLNHYKKLAETASGMMRINAQKHADEILGNYPNLLEEVKDKSKEKK